MTIRRILQGVRGKKPTVDITIRRLYQGIQLHSQREDGTNLLAYSLPKETVAAITILYRNTKAGVRQGDTLAPYLFIICLDYVLRTLIDKIRENGFELKRKEAEGTPQKQLPMPTTPIT